MASTGEQIRLAVGRELNRALSERLMWEVINSGAVATSLTDATRLLSSRFTPQQFQDWAVRVSSGTRDGDASYAGALTPSSGLLAVSPSFSGALANNDTLELWSPQLPHPDVVDAAIDEALSNLCVRRRLVPLTWVIDGDFVMSGVTNWTTSNATATKAEKSGLERFTEQTLRVNVSGLAGYAGQTVNVRGGEGWFVFVLAQADVGTARLVMYDVTNSAEIDLTGLTRSSWTGESFQCMRGAFTIPSTCELMSVRPGGVVTDDTYWANLCVYPQDAREFVLPARVLSAGMVGDFVEIVGDDWPEQYPMPLAVQPEIVDVGGGQVRVILRDGPVGQRAIFWYERAHYAALRTAYNTAAARLAGDAAETDCPLEYVKWAALYTLFPDRFAAEWERAKFEYTVRMPARVRRPSGTVSS